MVDPVVESFVLGALPPAPARVLEVGAGSGELAARLREAGYEVVAIDPEPSGAGVRELSLHELPVDDPPFDAAVAIVSLHHVEPLAESMRRLAEAVRPGGALVVDEIDVEAFDERAATWWLAHHAADGHDQAHDHGRGDGHGPGHATEMTPAEMVAGLRRHCHALPRIRRALGDEGFVLGEPAYGPYLHRWEMPAGMREAEEARIAGGEMPAVGVRFTGTRRG